MEFSKSELKIFIDLLVLDILSINEYVSNCEKRNVVPDVYIMEQLEKYSNLLVKVRNLSL